MSRAVKGAVVAVVLIVALGLRIAEVERTSYRPINDAGSYLTLASEVAHTGDYSLSHASGSGAGGTRGPSAYFAPGYPYFLALVDLIDGHETRRGAAVQPARISQAVLGTVTVALIGLVALEAFDPVAGLIGLVLATFYPVLIELCGTLVAENLLTALILAAVYTGLRVRRATRTRTRVAWVTATGVLTGLATLTHENGILILIPLIFAVWPGRGGRPGRGAPSRRPGRSAPAGRPGRSAPAGQGGRVRFGLGSLAAPALLVATTALMILPWTIRNEVTMHRFIPVSDETGITLVGTYNAASAASEPVPYKWRIFYGIPGEKALIHEAGTLTEPEIGDKLQSQALHYISDHPSAPLAVAYHNTRRLFELEGAFAWKASALAIDLPTSVARIGVISFWILCLLALAGALTRLARAAPYWIWGVPVLLAISVVLVNVETPRFRAPIDPFLILLAAAAVSTAGGRLTSRLRGAPVVGEARRPETARPAQLVEVVERLS